jgi:hypothetical protein
VTTIWIIAGLAVLLVGFVVWIAVRFERAGATAVEAGISRKEVKAANAAAEAQANAPRTPEAIDVRLRKGGGL